MTEKHITTREIRTRKGNTPMVVLTAYSAPMANILDAHADILLVGDSLGMVVYGMESTLPVTLEMMIAHGKAVVRGSKKACVVVDMPFGSYQESKALAFKNAAKILAETGCDAVKLEGGEVIAKTVSYLTSRGIPVMGHVGLEPQSVKQTGGYRMQGKDKASAAAILKGAKSLEKSGAFALVLEHIPPSLAKDITQSISIPTIGIGASNACDGQVLVSDDMLGLFEHTPSFVKVYGNLRHEISKAAQAFARDVIARKFPKN